MDHNVDEGFSEGLWLNKLLLYAPRICYLRHSDYSCDHPVENVVHHLDENTYVSDGFFPCTSDIQYVLRKEGYSILLCMQYQLEEMEELFSITSIGQSIKVRILQRAKRLHLSGSDLLSHQFLIFGGSGCFCLCLPVSIHQMPPVCAMPPQLSLH